MAQFYVPRNNFRGTFLEFEPGESRHLLKVLRKKAGDRVQIFDGEGLVADVKLTDLSDPDRLKAEMVSPATTQSVSGIRLNLYPAAIKGDRFEWLIEKVTELGASRIVPVRTERTLIRLDSDRAVSRAERWRKVAISAAKQCGRTVLPEIVSLTDFKTAVHQVRRSDLNFLLWEGEEKAALSEHIRKAGKIAGTVNLFTGPEGGFTLEEVQVARKCGLLTVRLGDNILRAETAAIAAVSLCLLAV